MKIKRKNYEPCYCCYFKYGKEPSKAKVPEITIMFWIIKILTTAMGEAMSDAMGDVSPVLCGVVAVALWITSMVIQFRVTEYWAPTYWCCVATIAIAGTALADGFAFAVGLDSPYYATVPTFLVLIIILFSSWWYFEGNLSIHSINCRRQEGYYWWAVVLTFSLGTALGDLFAFPPVGLGFWKAALVYAGIFGLGIIMYLWNFIGPWKINSTFIFWYSYTWTRPVGATIIDFISQPNGTACTEPFSDAAAVPTTCPNGLALGFGDWEASLTTLGMFIILVAFQTILKRDIQNPDIENQNIQKQEVTILPSEESKSETELTPV